MITRKDVQDYAKEHSIKSSDLDETVHDTAADYAARVNNSGVPEQINYLVDNLGSEQTLTILKDVVDYYSNM